MNVEVDKLFGAYVATSYSRFYPDITFEQALRPEALDCCASDSKPMRVRPARGSGTHRGTGGDVRRSSIGDEFEQSASSSAYAEHGGRSDTGSRRNRARPFGHRRAAVCHRRVCRRALLCWSTTRILDIRGTRP